MTSEYLFFTNNKLEFPLDESINVLNKIDNNDYIVANTDIISTQIYAPEINFYMSNSKDEIGDIIKNIKSLYDIRSLAFDLAQDMDFTKEVNNKLLIVTTEDNQEKYENILKNDVFTSVTLSPEMIIDINGHIGELKVLIKKEESQYEIEFDQIIWKNAPQFAMKQSGVYDPNALDLEEIEKTITANLDGYKYKNFIVYDSKICQYNERTVEICSKCEEVCPTISILKEDKTRHLLFSDVDCHGCGGCVSVCPSGALDYTQMPRGAFSKLVSFYEDKTALIIPRKMQIENLAIDLDKGILPLSIEGEKYLHETHFMSLLQTSGNPVIFYTDFISKGTGDVIRFINEIFMKKYNKKAIFVCKDKDELKEAFKNLKSIRECKYGINENNMKKREVFAVRLAHLVGEDDLGIVKTGEHVHYGNIQIKEENCTLCLSCVGACNVKALTAHPQDNSLRFNPAICTNCTYCEVVCPEADCLVVIRDEISLNPSYFQQNIMAKDELFACVECGKEFA
ncbi:MAG: 4Fe-4S ferredoxin, partial [Epsilonproteobacteria bacterium]|nr:4Fe-4S ferredoxin [Campylobacterota bacterium]